MKETAKENYWLRIFVPCLLLASFVLTFYQWPSVVLGAEYTVDNLEELYAAVNAPNPNNESVLIRISPGTYILDPKDANGQPRPHGGSLRLKNLMTLQGGNENWDQNRDGVPDARLGLLDAEGREVYTDPATETIIDGSQLNVPVPGAQIVAAPIFAGCPALPCPAVGEPFAVAVKYLTVRGGPRAQGGIEIRGPGNNVAQVTVQGCTLEKGRRGLIIDGLNRWNGANTQIFVHAEGNVIRDQGVDHIPGFEGVYFGWGIQSQNGNLLGSQISLHVKANRFTRNKVGLFLEATEMQNLDLNAVSAGNIYENAVLTKARGGARPVGTNLLASGIFMLIFSGNTQANGNDFHLHSQGDSIYNNEGWAGLYVEPGVRTTNNVEMLDNRMNIQLIGTRFVKLDENGELDGPQNQDARLSSPERRDITIVGANHSNDNDILPPPEGFTGVSSGNQVNLLMRKTETSCEPTDYDPDPQDLLKIVDNFPEETEINLLGSLKAFERTNTGWNCLGE